MNISRTKLGVHTTTYPYTHRHTYMNINEKWYRDTGNEVNDKLCSKIFEKIHEMVKLMENTNS